MVLTTDEKQDIIRKLEKDEPLPDKYRFLLFGGADRQIELVWNGKSGDICDAVLPFQVIEQVDEPRAEKPEDMAAQGDFLDSRGRQRRGWVNKLIWGDNKLILSSLRGGAMRRAIDEAGGIKLIYIDPPFDVGANFSMDIEIGDAEVVKERNMLEEIAYRDTWGKGHDSFLAMIYERLALMKDLLADDGSIYVHCDHRVSSYIKIIMDEIFGEMNFRNIITWRRQIPRGKKGDAQHFAFSSDYMMLFTKSGNSIFNKQVSKKEITIEEAEEKYQKDGKGYFRTSDPGSYSYESLCKFYEEKRLYAPRNAEIIIDEKNKTVLTSEGKKPSIKYYRERIGDKVIEETPVDNIWSDIAGMGIVSSQHIGYPTQKPEDLLERVIKASSNEGDLVADFFCGSGTTAVVAERLGRKWIASDLGKFAIHTTRKRMIGVQRQLKADGSDFRAFEILNLGEYERQHYLGVHTNLRGDAKQQYLLRKRTQFDMLILNAYKAQEVTGFRMLQGKVNHRMVCIGHFNLPIDRLFMDNLLQEAKDNNITAIDVLGFEYESGLFPEIQEHAKKQGIDLALKYIPPDVFDKRAVEKNEVNFYDVSFVDFKIHKTKKSFSVELTDFAVAYSKDAIIKKGGEIKIENSQIFFRKKGSDKFEALTKNWSDWIDYWAVDFDFESKKEFIRVQNDDGEWVEQATGNFIFENEWQSFRTKKDRNLELKSVSHDCSKGKRKVAVKVVDVFGNDTMRIKEVDI